MSTEETAQRPVTESTKPPEGAGWEPWTAARAPEAELWVNEQRREILIFESGSERRIDAADAATFALEVAELERYYDAAPKSSGARDACAMLTQPARAVRTDHSAGATLTAFLGVLGMLAAILVGCEIGGGERAGHGGRAVRRPRHRSCQSSWQGGLE